MSSRELTEWMAYDAIEPIGGYRVDYGFAMVAAMIANANRDPKKRPQPFEIEDFMLFKPKRELSQDEIAAKIAVTFGAPD